MIDGNEKRNCEGGFRDFMQTSCKLQNLHVCEKRRKMKLTEEKRYWNFCLRLFLAKVRLNVLGKCIT